MEDPEMDISPDNPIKEFAQLTLSSVQSKAPKKE
jgi:hypothetical protein